jgi:signal transduction histidine kinase
MNGLIEDIMDFARGRLGSGITLKRKPGTRIEPILAQVIDEIWTAHPDCEITTRFDLEQGVEVDQARIAQMFSNLLGNAVANGAADHPIMVEAAVIDGQLDLSASNGGDPI